VPRDENKTSDFVRCLAAVIRERREELGMSLTQLGTAAGLSQQSVSYLERLMRLPNIETLHRIADALDIRLSVLIQEAEKRMGL